VESEHENLMPGECIQRPFPASSEQILAEELSGPVIHSEKIGKIIREITDNTQISKTELESLIPIKLYSNHTASSEHRF